jgi:catechol 2,3-dioxygenase-like lactoylglutathione lyase family enzyme
MFKWLSSAFGGERGKLGGRLEALKYAGGSGTVWVLVQKANETPKPSMGAAIDHVGWKTPNLDKTAADLKAKGVKFTTEPRAAGALKIAFVEGPDAVRVEVVQR